MSSYQNCILNDTELLSHGELEPANGEDVIARGARHGDVIIHNCRLLRCAHNDVRLRHCEEHKRRGNPLLQERGLPGVLQTKSYIVVCYIAEISFPGIQRFFYVGF